MPAAFTAQQENLLGAIRRHLAELDAKYGFTARLARENGWTLDFARKVVDEYAKFLFIARAGGHPVSPSPIIGQAWHLHLVHTEDYWGRFCPDILHPAAATVALPRPVISISLAAVVDRRYIKNFGHSHH